MPPGWSPNGKFIIADVIKHENGSSTFQQADNDYVSMSHSEISGLIKVPVPMILHISDDCLNVKNTNILKGL